MDNSFKSMTWLKAAALAVVLAVVPAAAQEEGYEAGQQYNEQAPRVIKPSQALRIAMGVTPQAKPLGVQLRGSLYIVKLKQGNRVIRVRVDAATGDIR